MFERGFRWRGGARWAVCNTPQHPAQDTAMVEEGGGGAGP